MATAVPTPQSTVTVNAAFLQEIKEVNQELWRLLENLRHLCSSAITIQEHAAQLIAMLRDLRDQLALHFALEEAYGYFDDPALVVPTVAHQAAMLRAEHRQLYSKAIRLSHDAEHFWCDGNLADLMTRTPDQFWEFESILQQHESNENELIMRQFDDVGVGD
jgi:hypothetical protein